MRAKEIHLVATCFNDLCVSQPQLEPGYQACEVNATPKEQNKSVNNYIIDKNDWLEKVKNALDLCR